MYYTYMIRCEDNSIYTGMTLDLERRMNEHFGKTEKCAKYTLRHNPKKLLCAWKSENRSLASKLEFHIKKLSKDEKEVIVSSDLKKVFALDEKIDINNYKKVSKKDINKINNLLK